MMTRNVIYRCVLNHRHKTVTIRAYEEGSPNCFAKYRTFPMPDYAYYEFASQNDIKNLLHSCNCYVVK